MSDYRRYFVPGGTYFFTLVIQQRRSILVTDAGRRFLREAISVTQARWPFQLIAICLLPDHWHLVMSLPPDDHEYSKRLQRIKRIFTEQWILSGRAVAATTASQKSERRKGVWQPRFWEHTVRDEEDYERCVDYVHWNPRKHQLVERVKDWPWSSFHRFVREGQYNVDWGGEMPRSSERTDQWGE